MPSIEWYLRDESVSDEEKAESVITSSTMGSDPNQYVSKKLDENVTGFEVSKFYFIFFFQLNKECSS